LRPEPELITLQVVAVEGQRSRLDALFEALEETLGAQPDSGSVTLMKNDSAVLREIIDSGEMPVSNIELPQTPAENDV